MNLFVMTLRFRLKAVLERIGLLGPGRRVWRLPKFLFKPEFRRRERAKRRQFLEFKQQAGGLLKPRVSKAGNERKRVLIVSVGFLPQAQIELGFIKALEMAGYDPVVLIVQGRQNLEYYKLAGFKEIHFLDAYTEQPDPAVVEAVLDRNSSVEDLQEHEYAGVRVGRFAVSSALRRLRFSFLDLKSPRERRILVQYLADSIKITEAARNMMRRTRPDLMLLWDAVYTPEGELFESCLNEGVDAILWGYAHKNNTLMFKRYTRGTRNEHPASLSPESWKILCAMAWTEARRIQLERELRDAYAGGEWYGSAGTQFDKKFLEADLIRRRVGLDPSKKTAFIFPHIFWDASLTSGADLFRSYEEWFVETVRAAAENSRVNWVIKIHPAHAGKGLLEGYRGEPAEVGVLRRHLGALPPHISLIPAESDISTFSLFEMMDYCVTVRGTVGIEAARLGIPVLTAGTGRYDRKGFTIDSDSREEYLKKIARINEMPKLTPDQRELAERYAYGLFILRPLPLTTYSFAYHKDYGPELGFAVSRINISKPEDWDTAPDLRAFARWVKTYANPDFLMPLPDEDQ